MKDTPPSTPATARRVVALATLSAVAVLGVFWARNGLASRRHVREGDAALATGDADGAILAYRHGVESYAPLLGAHREAMERLIAVGDDRLAVGDTGRALFAFRSARFGALSTRHLFTPFESYLPRIQRGIERAVARDRASPTDVPTGLSGYRGRRPDPVTGLLGGLCFALWLGTLPLAAYRGFTREGRPKKALLPIALGALALLLGWCGLISSA